LNVADLDLKQVAALTSTQITGLGVDQIKKFSAGQIGKISEAAIVGITGDQLAALDDAQTGAITAKQMAAIVANSTSLEGIAKLTDVQVNLLSNKVIVAMGSTGLNKIDPDNFNLSDTQIQALTADQLNGLSSDLFVKLTDVQVAALQSKQIKAMTPDTMAKFDATTTPYLKSSQIAIMTAAQLAKLDLSAIAADERVGLSSTQLKALVDGATGADDAAKVGAIKTLLGDEWVTAINATGTKADDTATPPTAAVNPPIMAKLTKEQIAAWDWAA